MKAIVFVLWAACLSALAGCGANETQLRTRAAFDLKCAESDIKVADLGGGHGWEGHGVTRGVTGCGRQATYVYDAQGHTWVMNSDAREGDTRTTGAVAPAAK